MVIRVLIKNGVDAMLLYKYLGLPETHNALFISLIFFS